MARDKVVYSDLYFHFMRNVRGIVVNSPAWTWDCLSLPRHQAGESFMPLIRAGKHEPNGIPGILEDVGFIRRQRYSVPGTERRNWASVIDVVEGCGNFLSGSAYRRSFSSRISCTEEQSSRLPKTAGRSSAGARGKHVSICLSESLPLPAQRSRTSRAVQAAVELLPSSSVLLEPLLVMKGSRQKVYTISEQQNVAQVIVVSAISLFLLLLATFALLYFFKFRLS